MSEPNKRRSDQFVVRMPPGLRERISEEARKNLRSANAQIVWMLQRQIDQNKAAPAGAATPTGA